ncbi:MAG: outer membrane beta-barrel protein [Bdellovibrionales bacterium]|nr:outer membrane beta-barrel protein [Bdellovibrionales bacterium]
MFPFKILLSLYTVFFLFSAFGAKSSDVVIVNTNTNKSEAQAPSQTVIAPALNPSKAKKLRNAREGAEVQTESLILEKVEQERLKSEQNLLNKIFGSSQPSSNQSVATPQSPLPTSTYTSSGVEKVYVSAGLGTVRTWKVENDIESAFPSYFLSIGGSAQKYFSFDFSINYSRHYLTPRGEDVNKYPVGSFIRIDQPTVAIAIRLVPLSGKIRPYVGLSAAYINRKRDIVDQDRKKYLNSEFIEDVDEKKWYQSFDGGISGGMDIDLGPNLGLNIDLRYHRNIDTEESTGHFVEFVEERTIAFAEAESLIISANLRFYF